MSELMPTRAQGARTDLSTSSTVDEVAPHRSLRKLSDIGRETVEKKVEEMKARVTPSEEDA
jgi:hypothetical protein